MNASADSELNRKRNNLNIKMSQNMLGNIFSRKGISYILLQFFFLHLHRYSLIEFSANR